MQENHNDQIQVAIQDITANPKPKKADKKPSKEYFEYSVYISAGITILIAFIFIYYIFSESFPVFQREGLHYILGTKWNYLTNDFGMQYLILGTLAVTVLTLIIACPIGIFNAIFLTEFAPPFVRKIMNPMTELLVGIPSVVYGYFGGFILTDYFYRYIKPFIGSTLGFIPIFKNVTSTTGDCILLASFILAIMILPTITVLTQEALRAVPREQYEASISLGATRWETIRRVIIPSSLSGIIAATLLGTMRAMGETMAIVMLAGNSLHLPTSILDTTYTMTSKLVVEILYRFPDDSARSALMGIAAVLFIMEMGILIAVKAIGARLK